RQAAQSVQGLLHILGGEEGRRQVGCQPRKGNSSCGAVSGAGQRRLGRAPAAATLLRGYRQEGYAARGHLQKLREPRTSSSSRLSKRHSSPPPSVRWRGGGAAGLSQYYGCRARPFPLPALGSSNAPNPVACEYDPLKTRAPVPPGCAGTALIWP